MRLGTLIGENKRRSGISVDKSVLINDLNRFFSDFQKDSLDLDLNK